MSSATLQPSSRPAAPAELAALRREAAPLAARLQDALNAEPQSRAAFERLLGLLIACRVLRGANLNSLAGFVAEHWHRQPWVREYRDLLYLPRFLNVAFVGGRCNLSCRMCHGTQGRPAGTGALRWFPAARFEQLLCAAPTAGGVTLSAGDSDPLLHPQLDEVLALAERYEVTLDFYTNGHALSPARIARLVASGAVQVVNFSLDAATPATYERLRCAPLARVLGHMAALRAARAAAGTPRPLVSSSFVALADNIAELPAFVDLVADYGAFRVYVEELIGWGEPGATNQPATDHPGWRSAVAEAAVRAARRGVRIELPERLRAALAPAAANDADASESGASPAGVEAGQPPADATGAAPGVTHRFCPWLGGVWVDLDGRYQPCCLISGVADLGGVEDGPVDTNDHFRRVKWALFDGSVFAACLEQRACAYVQQQKAAGKALKIIAP